ncbi:hypothetical protein N9N00_00755 [Schleiferiaceae bacterium]|jgi:hypothetical protein|nr:hypothetical protein [Schleiferiaceae bacterium]
MLDWNDLLLTHPRPLQESCSEEDYALRTQESRTRFWPVVEEGLYSGLMGPDGHVLSVPAIQVAQHPVDALAIASAWEVDCVAVCEKETFQGSYKSQDIAERIGSQWAFQLPGSTIWFEHPISQHFGGEWIRGIEAEGVRVVAFSTDLVPERNVFRSFARLDQIDPTAALATLERFGCTILGYYPKGYRAEEVEDNLDHLLHYLDL